MLKTLEESLLEAQGGNIDLAIGYSVLKDIFKRQNFTVRNGEYIGKKKVQFTYTDPDSKDPEKIKNVGMEFFVKKLSSEEFKKIEPEFIKTPKLSFVTNKYGKFIGSMSRKQGVPEKVDGAEPRLKLWKEYQYVDKETQYIYVVEFFNSKTGEFVDGYKIDIVAKK